MMVVGLVIGVLKSSVGVCDSDSPQVAAVCQCCVTIVSVVCCCCSVLSAHKNALSQQLTRRQLSACLS